MPRRWLQAVFRSSGRRRQVAPLRVNLSLPNAARLCEKTKPFCFLCVWFAQEMQKDYYKGSPFFSENMLYTRWGPEEEASGFMEKVVMPAFQGDEPVVLFY